MQAERTANKAALAQRLITGLAGEFTRWTESIQMMAAAEGNLVGDVLLSASFVSYAGAALGWNGSSGLLRYGGAEGAVSWSCSWAPSTHLNQSMTNLPRHHAHSLARLLPDHSTGAFNAELRHELVAVSRADK